MSEDEVAVLEEEIELLKSDPAFKLFGRRIPVLPASSESTQGSSDTYEVTKNSHTSDDTKSSLFFDNMPLNKISSLHIKSISNPNTNGCKESPENENKFNGKTLFQTSHEKSSTEREKLCDQKSNMNAEGNVVVAEGSEESNKKEDDMPKKPDKLLPCPRCDSMDTKFCYYNNYNVNQPRHFCRNCQRYWTAGGLLRSVPVGAGRRKNKHSAVPHQRNLSHTNDCDSDKSIKFEVSDLEMTGGRQSLHDVKKGTTNHLGTYVGRETSSLFSQENENIQKSSSSSSRMKGESFWNNSCSSEWRSYEKRGELGTLDSFACASSSTNFVKSEMESLESNNTPKDEGVGYELPNNSMSWVSGPPPVWSLYCGSLFGNSPYMNVMRAAMSNPETFQAPAMMPWFQPGTGPCSGFPWPFPSDPMWGQASWGAAWGMPLRPVVRSSKSSDSSLSMLGKHTRDMSASQPESKGDGYIWVPKTLRIDDPEEAAKSSIWATLGPGSKPESITSGGIFKAFQPKTEDKDNTKTPVRVLCANPAASARSASFNESN